MVLDKYQELESQTIYFASPDQLNDPMEGFRDIVWRGDKIVWTNFVKHFVYCLHEGYFLLRTTGNSRELGVDDIPFLGSWDQTSASQGQGIFEEIWHRFHNLPKMPEIIMALAKSNRKIRYRELEFYLRSIHHALLAEIEEIYTAHGVVSEPGRVRTLEGWSVHAMLEDLLESIIMFKKIYAEKSHTEEEVHITLLELEARENNRKINLQRSRRQTIVQRDNDSIREEIFRKNCQLVIGDFPRIYLNEVERLLWPKWYAACFMKNYHNSSVWGHYGDGHRGACLIFETTNMGESNGLKLNKVRGKSEKTMPFHEVRYANKPGEVDFFRSIGRLSVPELIKLWYTDSEGNRSECASHIRPDGNKKEDWQEIYWKNFYRDITTKTKDWKYEQEYRLILGKEIRTRTVHGKKIRTLTYDFDSLKGIIFGIKTSDEDRSEIIRIIQNKREKYKRSDFKYYQAYYFRGDGNIHKYELALT